MKIYVVRHGRSTGNEKHIIQGRKQYRLSELGRSQAQGEAEKLKDVKFDLILSSPLMRTMQTANIINQFHNVPIVKDDRLLEDDKGIFTGRTDKQIKQEEWDLFNKDPALCGVETIDKVFVRVQNFIDFLKEKYNNKQVLVVTHDHVALMLDYCSRYETFDENKFKVLQRFKNAECRQLDL